MADTIYQTHSSSSEMELYGIGHNPRYNYMEKLILSLNLPKNAKVLDVGASFFTLRLLKHFQDVSTLGFPEAKELICKMPPDMKHYPFDLNDSRDPSAWIELPKSDLIVFAEVIEHLPTAPQQILRFLASALKPGGILVIQTPNAISLDKRLKMVCGVHPFELIRENWREPGHFREYTKSDLVQFAKETGFEVVLHEFRSYFLSPRLIMRIIDVLVIPFPFLRRGQTIVLRAKG